MEDRLVQEHVLKRGAIPVSQSFTQGKICTSAVLKLRTRSAIGEGWTRCSKGGTRRHPDCACPGERQTKPDAGKTHLDVKMDEEEVINMIQVAKKSFKPR